MQYFILTPYCCLLGTISLLILILCHLWKSNPVTLSCLNGDKNAFLLLSSSAPQSSWDASAHMGYLCDQGALFGKMIIEYPWCLIDRPARHERYSAMAITGMYKNVTLEA
jgi:hypothetical protein